MKNLLPILLLLCSYSVFSQEDSTQPDSPRVPVVTTPLHQRVPVVGPPRRIITRLDSLKVDTSAMATDSASRAADSLALDTLVSSIPANDTIQLAAKYTPGSDSARFLNSYYLSFTNPVRYTVTPKKWEGKEEIFYTVIALLILFALLRNAFRRYVGDLFRMFFRTSIRQRQIRDQMLQSPLPSLMFNIFFTLSAGVFVALLFFHFGWAQQMNRLLLILYTAMMLGAIYLGKYFILRMVGWLFGAREATATYIFIVFTTNKVLGVLLLPFIVILSFTSGYFYQTTLTLSYIVLAALFLYRYFLSFVSVNRSLKIHFFHFLLYLAAFEILPLLLINKLLVTLLDQLY